ncbi:MAG TPA: hypothetical protein V6D22_17085 [Candidatus Obscuribacterales bacterium]
MTTDTSGIDFEDSISGAPERFIAVKEMELGQTVTGVYLGAYWSYGPEDKPFETPARQHRILTTDREVIGIDGKGGLNNHLVPENVGKIVKIVFDGKEVMEKGKFAGKDKYKFRVQFGKTDNASTTELKKIAAGIPDYQPERPPAPAPLPTGTPELGGGLGETPNLFANEQVPLIGG